MRHKKSKVKLNRTSAHRRALVKNLVRDLLIHESIRTTLPKAKIARRLAEKVITLAKEDNLKSKRAIYSILQNHSLTSKVCNEIAARFKNRPGGYTRVIALGNREGDGAQMALLSLVELKAKNQVEPKAKQRVKKKEIEEKEKPLKEKKIKETKKKEVKKEEKSVEEKKEKKGFLSNLKKYLGKGKSKGKGSE